MRPGLRVLSVAAVAASVAVACGGRALDAAGDAGTPVTVDGGADVVHVQGDAIQRACVFYENCGFLGFGRPQVDADPVRRDCLSDARFLASVSDISKDRWIACGASSTTCEAWIDCMTLHHGDYCATHRGESCVDNIAFHCSNEGGGNWPPQDCSLAPGTRCQIVPQYDLWTPLVAVCTTGEKCQPDNAQTQTCLGDKGALLCGTYTSVKEYVACDEFHGGQWDAIRGTETCTPAVGCAPAGTPCTSQDVTCDGTIATDCRFGRDGAPILAVTFDCAKSGQRCQPRGPGRTPACVPVAIECDPASFVPTCHGTTLDRCVLGKVEHIDCAAYGFPTCGVKYGSARCDR
jgi:hypothetical protein